MFNITGGIVGIVTVGDDIDEPQCQYQYRRRHDSHTTYAIERARQSVIEIVIPYAVTVIRATLLAGYEDIV